MTSGFVLGPGEGPAYGFHGSAAVIKASGEDTLGQLGVIESVYPAGLSVHEHVHGRYSTAVPAPLPWPELAGTPPAHGRSATSARTA
jgi:hypothetical protein